jgi:DNA-binding MurR/RpiR family transcriptional regulator
MAPSLPPTSFLAQIRHVRDALPPSEQRLGDFILAFPGDLASYNASELAALVEVSNATVTRFVRRLGYDGYEAARRHAREERAEGSPLFLPPLGQGAPEGSIDAHVQRAQQNIAATFAHVGEALVDEIAQAIVQARGVWFLGYRNNRHFAAYLRWQLAQLLPQTRVIPGPGETLGEHAVDLDGQDVLVVFALRRSPAIAARFAELAVAAGARVLYVTDPQSRAPAGARWVIRCHSAAPGPLDNHVALMLLCDVLATRAMAQAGAAGRQRLSRVEAAHDALAELRPQRETRRAAA